MTRILVTGASGFIGRALVEGLAGAGHTVRAAMRQPADVFPRSVEVVAVSDLTRPVEWRALLKGDAEVLDLVAIREQIFDACADGLRELQARFGLQAIQPLPDAEVVQMKYPVEAYPTKIVSFNLDKNPVVEGTLLGIKGQYLIFDTGVINIRKYTAYQLAVHQ